MRSVALECVCANMHGVRALDQVHDLLAPKLMPSKLCLCSAHTYVSS